MTTGYPEGYRDPDWDGTEEDFASKVVPARMEAVAESLNDRLKNMLPDGVRFEWAAPCEPSERFAGICTASGLEILRAPAEPHDDAGPPPDDLYMIWS